MKWRAVVLTGLTSGLFFTSSAGQLTPAQENLFSTTIGDRVDAETILGGDYGIGGGAYKSTIDNSKNANMTVNKFGGSGDIYPIRPLGDLGIGWQPQLQGSMGYLTVKNNFVNPVNGGDTSENKTFAIQFGGGVRFWFDDHFSIAPTVMGMYGHSENSYNAVSPFGLANQAEASREGLINWNADTWTVRPSLNFQYQYTWHRTIFTLSSEPTYFHTESFESSSSYVNLNGNAEMWANKIDVDCPLGVEMWGHELRTGGYFSRTDLFGDLQNGLNTDYYYDAHGRIVLDFLNQLWKVQWIGIGVSHLWSGNFTGWSYGVDVAFRF